MEDRCKAKGIQFETCDLAACSIPFDKSYFDLVVFTEVLEHIFAPPTKILEEIRSVMRSGGKLILSTPNIATLRARIRFLFGITPLDNPDDQMKKGWVHGHGHIHEYTMKEITSLLKGCGFTISSKTFLQNPISDALRGIDKGMTLRLRKVIYHGVRFLVPAFRPYIYIECYRP